MTIDTQGSVIVEHDGASYYFCESACAEIFEEDPERWINEEAGGPRLRSSQKPRQTGRFNATRKVEP